jgi:Cu/Ag efflux pump CusA
VRLDAPRGGAVDAGGHPHEPWLVRRLHAVYDPFLAWAMRNPLWVVGAALVGLAGAGTAYTRIGSTFMPSMDEGSPVLTIRKYATVGVEQTAEIDLRIQREIMARVPEVRAIRARPRPASQAASRPPSADPDEVDGGAFQDRAHLNPIARAGGTEAASAEQG